MSLYRPTNFISSQTGAIRTTGRKLDREQQSEHTLEIRITDSSSDSTTPLSSQVVVNVQVLDENDHSPVFLQDSYTFTVPFVSTNDFWSQQLEEEMELVVGQVGSLKMTPFELSS